MIQYNVNGKSIFKRIYLFRVRFRRHDPAQDQSRVLLLQLPCIIEINVIVSIKLLNCSTAYYSIRDAMLWVLICFFTEIFWSKILL